MFSIFAIHLPEFALDGPLSNLSQVIQFLSQVATSRTNTDVFSLPPNDNRTHPPCLSGWERLVERFRTNCFHFENEIGPNRFAELARASEEDLPELRLSISCKVNKNDASSYLISKKNRMIAQVQWRVSGALPALSFFRSFSRAGTWNHLISEKASTARGISNIVDRQPNIIHSRESVHPGEDPVIGSKGVYKQVTPLPGRPLWHFASDPVHRLVLLNRFGKDWLLRFRVVDDEGNLCKMGESLSYHFCPPDRLPQGYLDEICAMVAAGGTVAATHVRYNLERAYLIGYVTEMGVIVGNSSLKNPRPEYIEDVRIRSGLDLSGYVERGYTSVRPEYRGLGIGTKLLEGLTQRAGDRKIFSVISEDNEATKIIARRNRTRKVATYFSEKAGKPVGIWMPEWMIAQ